MPTPLAYPSERTANAMGDASAGTDAAGAPSKEHAEPPLVPPASRGPGRRLAQIGACGGEPRESSSPDAAEPPPAPPVPGDDAVAIANVQRVAAAPADAAPAARSLDALGSDLYAALVEGNDENLVFSPASILLALAMARAGAAGTTASEMDAVLHIDEPEAIHHALNGLTLALEARSGTIEVNGEPAELDSRSRTLWGQATLTWQDAFLDVLAREYGAGGGSPTSSPIQAARVAVNDWVADETRDRIQELIAAGMVDELMRMILVNAIYLKAPWAIPFEPDTTRPAPFTLLDGSTVEVPLMARSDTPWRTPRRGLAGGGASLRG